MSEQYSEQSTGLRSEAREEALSDDLTYPSVIEAHLMTIALERARVQLLGPSVQLEGHMDLADGFGEVTFYTRSFTKAEHTEIRRGTDVRLEYRFDGAVCSFKTWVIMDMCNGRFRLGRPYHIERTERRLVPRIPIEEIPGCRFVIDRVDGQEEIPLLDLSNAGVSVLWPVGHIPQEGELLDGRILIPGAREITARLEICYLSLDQVQRWTVGARFVMLRDEDLLLLTRIVLRHLEAHVLAA